MIYKTTPYKTPKSQKAQGSVYDIPPYILEHLVVLSEECAEIIQVINKIQRFGLNSTYKRISNIEHLHVEVGDFLGVLSNLVDAGLFDQDELVNNGDKKIEKLKKWTRYLPDGSNNPKFKDI